jgi:hypothetical protein
MAFLKLTIPKQQNEETPTDTLEVEDEAIVITSIASFYKVGLISYWVLSPQGLTFTKSGSNFSSLKLRKDNANPDDLTLEVRYATSDAKEVSGNITVAKMQFVSELPHDVHIKLNQ